MGTDAEVIAASTDDPARFGEIFDRHASVMFRYLVRRVGPDEADGLLGEVFRIAFQRRGSYDPCRPLALPWLYGIATNVIAHHRRSEARRLRATTRARGEGVRPDDAIDAVDASLDAADLWPRVASALATLPDAERDTLLLFAWEGLSYEQIADALDVPIGTVRSRLNRARGRIRELVAGRGEGQANTAPPSGGRISS